MKFLVKVMSMALAIFLIASFMPGVEVQGMSAAILVSLVIILLNIFLKPVLIFLTLPITVVSLGLFLLVINAAIILIASNLLKSGFKVDGFWVALLFSILLSITNSFIESIAGRMEEKEKDRY
ncbi:MAG TPA: phage holin family protein [Bacteroidia bacterium]|nr:phage holin family protein [Bacteroidia bacterium]HQF29030.1 phage holin family protein [Bacteroidia bacterium]HQK97268.1 phage holin family protein [Bacteroidia bacterium]